MHYPTIYSEVLAKITEVPVSRAKAWNRDMKQEILCKYRVGHCKGCIFYTSVFQIDESTVAFRRMGNFYTGEIQGLRTVNVEDSGLWGY